MKTILFSLLIFTYFLNPAPENPLIGKWKHPKITGLTIELKEDMSYEVDNEGDGVIDVRGTYALAGNDFIFNDKTGEMACTKAKGVYTFKVVITTLRFDKKEDDCPSREGALDGVTWEKVL